MRNQEAARYARWAAMAACAITLVVAAFYAERAVRAYLLRRHGPAPVSAAVQQQSADFSYSDVEQGHTIFTVRASHATQFKNEDRALLQDVWVTLYGRQGDRNDNIHTRECSYQPKAGTVQCAGDVDIDIQSANPSGNGTASTPLAQALHVKTSNLTFDRETGEASTPAPVDLNFAGGTGRGAGLHYDAHDSVLRIDHGVTLQMAASDRTAGLPVAIAAENLEFHRDNRVLALAGSVVLRQGDRTLSAEKLSLGLDASYRAQMIVAEGQPRIAAAENGSQFSVTADKFEASLDAAGTLQHVAANGAVHGARTSSAGTDHFSAERVEFAMLPQSNQLKEMTAAGGVTAESDQGGSTRTLKANGLHVTFAAGPKSAAATLGKQRVESAETLGPATIEAKSAAENLELKAAQFVAQFGQDGKLAKLLGHSGVELTRTPSKGAPQTSTAAELTATFDANGDWATVDETGNVRLSDSDRHATAGHAQVVQATDVITLDGSPVVTDATSQTSAGSVTINQKTGEIRANGSVVSTELASSSPSTPSRATPASGISVGEGAAHISADTLTGSATSGDVTFQGHARLWQGQAVVQADRIEIWTNQGKLQASGSVVGVFPQAAGQMPVPSRLPSGNPLPGKSNQAGSAAKAQPKSPGTGAALWQVRAPMLTYADDEGKAHLEGGVTASSDQGTLQSKTLDAFLAPAAAAGARPSVSPTAPGGRQLSQIVAQGGVTISQGDMHAKADQAQYSAADGKFTLLGGEPTITDASGNTTTGRSLTFYVASDTISVDSEQGSRTLTKHRVEK